MECRDKIDTESVDRCYLCGNEGDLIYTDVYDRLYNVPGIWNLRRCSTPSCGLVWLDPMPKVDQIWKLYLDYFTHEKEKKVDDNPDNACQINLNNISKNPLKRAVFFREFNYKHETFNHHNNPFVVSMARLGVYRQKIGRRVRWVEGDWGKRILDYGCGNGSYLKLMQVLGWNVTGYELDKQAANVARNDYGIKVYTDDFNEISKNEDAFDVITMGHVIEHLPDPVAILNICFDLLNPGGRIVIQTPNYNSIGRKIFGEFWRPLEVPRHLHLFSENTLGEIALNANFNVERIWTNAESASSIWQRSRVIKKEGRLSGGSPKALPKYSKRGSKLFSSIERVGTKFSSFGEELVMIARKSNGV